MAGRVEDEVRMMRDESWRRPAGGQFAMAAAFAALGAVAGAALALLFDPAVGHRRRVRLKDQAARRVRKAARRGRRLGRHGASGAVGSVRRTMHPHPAPPVDDSTLLARVESELFRLRPAYKGRVLLEAVNGIVCLRGQMRSPAEIDDVIAVVREIDGVLGVDSFLHLAGTPAPNKADALRASFKTL